MPEVSSMVKMGIMEFSYSRPFAFTECECAFCASEMAEELIRNLS